jgi:hypothetical protein
MKYLTGSNLQIQSQGIVCPSREPHCEIVIKAKAHDGVRYLVHENAFIEVSTARKHKDIVLGKRRDW